MGGVFSHVKNLVSFLDFRQEILDISKLHFTKLNILDALPVTREILSSLVLLNKNHVITAENMFPQVIHQIMWHSWRELTIDDPKFQFPLFQKPPIDICPNRPNRFNKVSKV